MCKYARKWLALLLSIFLVASYIPNAFADGNTVYIRSLEDFLAFADSCRLDSYSTGKTFCLTTDLDLSDTDFASIAVFAGTFDGGNHTISGLKIDDAGSVQGLFRYVLENAEIKNLSVEGKVLPVGSKADVGGIAGSNAGTIRNCRFTGQVSGSESIGGLVGTNHSSAVIVECIAYGTVSGNHFIGGIAGSNAGVIENCENRANINITAQQNSIDISDVTMDSLINTESSTVATDIGGIAGYSEGSILSCKNYGTVGYLQMGYNIGGIVGLQKGYVFSCENYGNVFGRKEVGGIVGQQEPEILLRYSIDTIQMLREQAASLSGLINIASGNAKENTAAIKNDLNRIEKHTNALEKAIDTLEAGMTNPNFEDLQTYLDALKRITSSISGIQDGLSDLWGHIDSTATDLEQDMNAISQQISVIENTLNHAEDNLGSDLVDVSDTDTEEDLGSKISDCNNFGAISADLHAGGIVGVIAFENDLDPEKDITVEGDTTLNAVGSFRSVIRNCANSGMVTVKRMRAGGIVGWLSIGLVHSCINYGNLENASADYVGGVAGESAGFIRNCKVRSVLSGDAYVGGICGRGCIVTDCMAMVSLSATERAGAILGFAYTPYAEVENPIFTNYYLQIGKDSGAIDGISYSGFAQGLTQDAFLELANADIFKKVTITFSANGETVLQINLPAGSSFSDIPQVPEIPGSTGYWEGIEDVNIENILFDLHIQAGYILYETVISSNLTDKYARPILLLQGDFRDTAKATLTVMDGFAALQEGQTLVGAWEFSASQCLSLQAGRLLIPEGTNTENMTLMVRDSLGKWNQRTYRISDSYLVFSLADGEDGIALVQSPADPFLSKDLLIAAGIGGAFVLLVGGLWFAIAKRKRKCKPVEAEAATE